MQARCCWVFRGERAGGGAHIPPQSESLSLQVVPTHTQTKILLLRRSAMCVQQFDDSRNQQFALHIEIRFGLHRYENQDIRCLKLYQ